MKIFNSKYVISFLIVILVILNLLCLVACANDEEMLLVTDNDEIYEDESKCSNHVSEWNNCANDSNQSMANESENSALCAESTIFVHISGEVKNPGVFELDADSRLFDAVQAAGGFTADADENYENLARRLEDGCQYIILSKSETELLHTKEAVPDTNGESSSKQLNHYNSDGALNINLATKDELMALDGIGESKANAIIEYRETNGKFGSTEELKQISGIGSNIFAKISSDITIDGNDIK